jgi:hypothetical protein
MDDGHHIVRWHPAKADWCDFQYTLVWTFFMGASSMKVLNAFIQVALAAFLLGCDPQQSTPDIDPGLGVDCFESHRASLPPGTQYEGIEKLVENRLTIRIMNGLEVVTLDCELNSGGAAQVTGK